MVQVRSRLPLTDPDWHNPEQLFLAHWTSAGTGARTSGQTAASLDVLGFDPLCDLQTIDKHFLPSITMRRELRGKSHDFLKICAPT